MRRDVLCRIPSLGTWPCDEIGCIWRHGNRAHPDEEFPADFARPKVQTSPTTALRYLGARMHRLVDREGKVSFWGPRYRGMD